MTGVQTCALPIYEDYPNVRRWIGNMKALRHWAKVHEVADGFAASLKEKSFVSI